MIARLRGEYQGCSDCSSVADRERLHPLGTSEVVHAVRVEDPYRRLEDDANPI